ncbi:hypothetical protein P175DRAFT_0443172 [Aspergillus ochraceoroseus IBT 24754]|uniref:Fcf2 pre-rRNA processing C-terminal domain-containing protein n=2 Tax=Aspergillus ochraceoroseus TaxID=138278 RepID=A0A2T5LQW3_9EURO|nr:uncharacterized protein P175DRAFT_0443172 [Aspergillus ochraceoroseus IBT 24754]KKK26035.1 hypothetical protein AOCH_000489 [Aspergillus ochraceoroseus]PTU18672.1 hypothetical protein P175DRAFT_0443172 [Aspergillus ochraceoroseus IBT 24754]
MTGGTSAQSLHNVNMTDDDIQQLLAEADERLRKSEAETTESSITLTPLDKPLPNIPKLSAELSLKPYLRKQNELAVIDTTQMHELVHKKNVIQATAGEQMMPKPSKSKMDKPTAGSDWFDLPKTEFTPELRRDLQLLRMRSILDPKRHYKKESAKAQPPKYSQVGTIIEGATEFFSGRITKRDRKKTFVEEALAAENLTGRFKTKYKDIQSSKTSGKKSFYKGLQAKRKGGGSRR